MFIFSSSSSLVVKPLSGFICTKLLSTGPPCNSSCHCKDTKKYKQREALKSLNELDLCWLTQDPLLFQDVPPDKVKLTVLWICSWLTASKLTLRKGLTPNAYPNPIIVSHVGLIHHYSFFFNHYFVELLSDYFRTHLSVFDSLSVPAVHLCNQRGIRKGVCPSYGWRCWGESGTGVVVVVQGGWRSTSLRERDCLAREEPRRREECRSTRALSLRVTFLL